MKSGSLIVNMVALADMWLKQLECMSQEEILRVEGKKKRKGCNFPAK